MAFEKLTEIVDQLDTSAKVASLVELSHFPDADVIGLSDRVYQNKQSSEFKSANMQKTAKQFIQGGLAVRDRVDKVIPGNPWYEYNVAKTLYARNALAIANQMAVVCGELQIGTNEFFQKGRGNYSTENSLLRRPTQLATFYEINVDEISKAIRTSIWKREEFEPVNIHQIGERFNTSRKITNNFVSDYVKNGFLERVCRNLYSPTPKTLKLVENLFVPIAIQSERERGIVPEIKKSVITLENDKQRYDCFQKILAPHLKRYEK